MMNCAITLGPNPLTPTSHLPDVIHATNDPRPPTISQPRSNAKEKFLTGDS